MVWMIESLTRDDGKMWEPVLFTFTRRAAREQVTDWKNYDVIEVRYRIVKYVPLPR